MDTKIKPTFWSDPVVEELPAEGKLAVIWLITAHISFCGWVVVSRKRFEFETGVSYEYLERAVQALGDRVVRHEKGWWVRNFIRYQIGVGEKLARNKMRFPIITSMAFIPPEIVVEMVAEYPCLEPSPSPPQALPQYKSRAEKE